MTVPIGIRIVRPDTTFVALPVPSTRSTSGIPSVVGDGSCSTVSPGVPVMVMLLPGFGPLLYLKPYSLSKTPGPSLTSSAVPVDAAASLRTFSSSAPFEGE
jgi:hypothetical protein